MPLYIFSEKGEVGQMKEWHLATTLPLTIPDQLIHNAYISQKNSAWVPP